MPGSVLRVEVTLRGGASCLWVAVGWSVEAFLRLGEPPPAKGPSCEQMLEVSCSPAPTGPSEEKNPVHPSPVERLPPKSPWYLQGDMPVPNPR